MDGSPLLLGTLLMVSSTYQAFIVISDFSPYGKRAAPMIKKIMIAGVLGPASDNSTWFPFVKGGSQTGTGENRNPGRVSRVFTGYI